MRGFLQSAKVNTIQLYKIVIISENFCKKKLLFNPLNHSAALLSVHHLLSTFPLVPYPAKRTLFFLNPW